MPRYFLSALLLLSCAVLPRTADAQPARALDTIPQQTTIRLRGPDVPRTRISGRLAEVTADTVFITRGAQRVAVPVADIRSVDVRAGRNHLRGMLQGAGYAALAGAVIGGVLVYGGDPNCDYCIPGRDLGGALIGSALGVVLFTPGGAIVGLAVGTPRWRPLQQSYSLQVAPVRDGVGVGLSIILP
ncbi:MAG TPA: hypothetical protein VEY93_07625 [Longimicrobium sp.]|nr:hypothetical protein [Longimicrobium sp.]